MPPDSAQILAFMHCVASYYTQMAQATDLLTYEGVPTYTTEPWTSQQQALARALAHEIRSTLASVKICAEGLGEPHPPSDGRRRRYATVVAEQASHIARVLDDFAAIMSYDSNNESSTTELVDINSAVWEAAHQLYSLARQRSLSLRLSPSSSVSIVKGSDVRLIQAVRGCLEHIMRTVAEGSQVQVAVEQVPDRTGRPAVEIQLECTEVPENSHRVRLLTPSALDTVTLRAVEHIVQAHQGYVEPLEGDNTGLRVVLPRHCGAGAGQLPNCGQWRAQTGPDNDFPQARAIGL